MVTAKTIGICDSQPVTIAGLQFLLKDAAELKLAGTASSVFGGMELVRNSSPNLVVIDKAFGLPAIMEWLSYLRLTSTRAVVWGVAINEAEALRLMQSGAHGVIRKTAEPAKGLACLKTVADGSTWMEDS